MNKTLVEIKKALVVGEEGEAANNIPPHRGHPINITWVPPERSSL